MSIYDDFIDHTRQEMRALAPVLEDPMLSDDRWTALDMQFLHLIRKAEPSDKNYIRTLQRIAGLEAIDEIEDAEALLIIGTEFVSRRQRILRREEDAFLGEGGAA